MLSFILSLDILHIPAPLDPKVDKRRDRDDDDSSRRGAGHGDVDRAEGGVGELGPEVDGFVMLSAATATSATTTLFWW